MGDVLKIIIKGELTDLNTYISAERTNKYLSAQIKKRNTNTCTFYSRNNGQIRIKVDLVFTWFCKDKKKDPDNIAFAKKFILDGFVACGLLRNDGWNEINGFSDRFLIDKNNPRVEIEISEVQE